MPVVVFDHRLKIFDEWIALFSANPPPPIGRWRFARGIDDPNRVHVVGEMDASEVDGVKSFFASENMRAVLDYQFMIFGRKILISPEQMASQMVSFRCLGYSMILLAMLIRVEVRGMDHSQCILNPGTQISLSLLN